MKILYLCADPGIPVLGDKGASVHVRGLAAALSRAGHAVVVAAPQIDAGPWGDAAPLAARTLGLGPSPAVVSVHQALKRFNAVVGARNSVPNAVRRILLNEELRAELARRFADAPPDIVYERASLYGTAGVQLARDLGTPLIVELNAPLAAEQSAYRAPGLGELAEHAERWLLSEADAVLAVSGPLREHAVSLGAAPARVHVMPNGVDPALFQPGLRDPDVRKRWGLGDGPVLGVVSGLRPWHGVDALPPLLEQLAPRHPDLRVVVVGDGPLRAPLARDFAARGLERAVVFTGWLAHGEVAALIRHFDVALAPYREPEQAFYFSPLKLFEYMACGVPVVGAAVGQIAEVVRDGETGLLYAPGDTEALALACDRVLTDSALSERLGAAAAAAIHGRYTWDHNAARVAKVARALLDGTAP
ncbi:MAG: glycosyltransferase family 4 protein [Candidatus Rokubacteria bacterium]|nr:glycosyltransferase family 4 protein [Candidatus Rokubacteria bacterium]